MRYVTVVDYYNAPVWYSPTTDDADAARQRYADEASRLYRGGIRAVYLMRDGVIVAQSRHNPL